MEKSNSNKENSPSQEGQQAIKQKTFANIIDRFKGEKSTPDHARKLHRLSTARWTIFICLTIIASLIIIQIGMPNETSVVREVIRDGISLLGTIATLALGFIAGSNIES